MYDIFSCLGQVPEQTFFTESMGFGLGSDLGFMMPNSASIGNIRNMEKPKELKDREKVERRLTEVRNSYVYYF